MGIKIIARNKRAGYDFFLEEKVEAGIQLQGTEVKSLREGRAILEDAYVDLDAKGEVWIHNLMIPIYKYGNITNHEEKRKRKLLLKHSQIVKLENALSQHGLTIIPLSLYFKDSLVKIEIALAKGKKLYYKRQSEAEKSIDRKLQRKEYND